jgi:hypothetical protein
MAPLSLIQLVSEQTMPNLLPILRLQPAQVLSIATESTVDRAPKIQSAALKAGIRFDHEIVRLSSMPSLAETGRALLRCVQTARHSGFTPVLNFTGGTKLMSIGAYQQAAAEQVPSFYVDTRAERLDDGATGPGFLELVGGDNSLSSLAPLLNLDILVAACGHLSISPGRDWAARLPAALFLFRNPESARGTLESLHGRNGLFPEGKEPRTPAEWLPFLNRPFPLSPDLRNALLPTGLVRAHGTNQALLPSSTAEELQNLNSREHIPGFHKRYFDAAAPLQDTLSFLTGSWFEVIVADAMHRSGRFRDIRWSAHVEQHSGALLEEDLVALDGLGAACVSCKTGSKIRRILPHLEEFQSRAQSIGGRMTRRFLALPALQDPRGQIRSHAKALGIQILTSEDLNEPAPFA